MARRPIGDATAAVATGPGKRALDALVAEPGREAFAALTALLDSPPVEVKALAFFLAWAGRLALGPVPTRRAARPDEFRAALETSFAQLARYLDHPDPRVCVAATLPLVACRGQARDVQRLFAERLGKELTEDLDAALRIASAVVARDTNVPSMVVTVSRNYADAIARQLDGRGATVDELTNARQYGQRRLSKLAWFPREFETVLRALIAERPMAEREARALAFVAERPIDTRAVELVFAHREVMPRGDRAEILQSMLLLRGTELTAVQRTLMTAPSYYPDRGLVGSIRWPGFRVPVTALGRAIVCGTGSGPLAEIVQTSRGPTPVYVALLDLLAEASVDKWPTGDQRIAIDALFARWSPAQRAALDAAVSANPELGDPSAYCELAPGTPWPR